MAVKRLKPSTPAQRHKYAATFVELFPAKPTKALMKGTGKSGGRNSSGKMTMRYLGGGHKRKYRTIDFKRDKFGIPATIASVEYDPNRSARIALAVYADGEKRYIIAPKGITVGQKVNSGKGVEPEIGNAMYLSEVPMGAVIHNIELKPNQGAKLVRSAGSYAQVVSREGKYVGIKMPSTEIRLILGTCLATIGTVSNPEHNQERSGKAGKSRWLGRRPRVRAVAMNPVDHPMGGGEGRASGGHPRSRNGLAAKGLKTRELKKASNKYIIERRKK